MPSVLCSVNGFPIIDFSIEIPRIGVWMAEMAIEPGQAQAQVFVGRATLQLASMTFIGTFNRNGPTQRNTVRARVFGGNGGFGLLLKPKGYRNTTLQQVLKDILGAAGEVLSPASDPTTLAFPLPFWTISQVAVGVAITSLMLNTGASWRVLSDGTTWVGPETFPLAATFEYQPLRFEPEMDRIEIASDNPVIFPGQVFQGKQQYTPAQLLKKQISYVQHRLDDTFIRTRLVYE